MSKAIFRWQKGLFEVRSNCKYFMAIVKPCPHLHLAGSTYNQLQASPTSSIYLHPALCNTLNIIRTKISHVVGPFPKIQAKKCKVVRFVAKLAHMISGGCGFLFRHWFSEFLILNPFLGKFGLKKSELSVSPKN